MSSFGAGGSIGHVLLTPHHKLKKLKLNASASDDVLPRLVVVSGRTKEAVDCILDDVNKFHLINYKYTHSQIDKPQSVFKILYHLFLARKKQQ